MKKLILALLVILSSCNLTPSEEYHKPKISKKYLIVIESVWDSDVDTIEYWSTEPPLLYLSEYSGCLEDAKRYKTIARDVKYFKQLTY